ncbi:FHA domain-containing protein [Acinetobacter johnsonii]|uniref:FHA domain-containing protein n=1 Tax=Acinetobacter johnsonii TaxID=40214 RepID=UPI001F258D03|nr:FHA domain-containing protein [Acinetobacter johnsonii]UJA05753.1 FHA domain-containing protein [Acinetobacter johnsonii]
MTWKIQAITGELTGQEISIDRDMLVGRHQTADIVLQQSEISRKHATFLLKEHALWLQDLGSSNGTYVNDVQIAAETLLKQGDIVQFASLKFSVFEPAKALEEVVESVEAATLGAAVVEAPISQPSEAVATSETAQAEVGADAPVVESEQLKTAAQHMSDQGMPELKERDGNVSLTRDGMPQNVGIPKPAPIPAGVDLTAPSVPQVENNEAPKVQVEQEAETQKNASLGLISIIVLIILAIIAWLMFK